MYVLYFITIVCVFASHKRLVQGFFEILNSILEKFSITSSNSIRNLIFVSNIALINLGKATGLKYNNPPVSLFR